MKVIGFLLVLAFVSLTWYGFILYSSIPALIFAVLSTIIMLVNVIKFYNIDKNKNDTRKKEIPMDMIGITLFSITFLSFLVFVALSMTYGGSAASDAYASEFNENYEVGSFYLSDHGHFVEVAEDIWRLMDNIEKVIFPLFMITFIWNFIYIAKKKGFKSMFNR